MSRPLNCSTHWIRGCVGPRVGLDDVKKRIFLTLPGIELQTFGRPARSQSLYRLHYPSSLLRKGLWRKKRRNLPVLRATTVYIYMRILRRKCRKWKDEGGRGRGEVSIFRLACFIFKIIQRIYELRSAGFVMKVAASDYLWSLFLMKPKSIVF
jgi:hypothetical protein